MATNPASPANPALVRLPPRPTRLIGREREVAALRELLLRDDVRLVTVTGPPGVGKTRLAIEVASGLADFAHGVWFVDLTTAADAELVMPSIARTVGLDRAGDTGTSRPNADRIHDYFLEKDALLILDNFEHVLDAAPQLGQVLAECSHLKILATSRIPLQLQWEHEFALDPLSVDHKDPDSDSEHPAAVMLFADRAQAVNAGFRLTDQNLGLVANICSRLDGLPLAIELAAAQVRILTLNDLLAHLERRQLDLAGGPRDLPQRHQTLRAAISWSYGFLDPAEQAVFRRLTVFTGGFTLRAVEAVCLDESVQNALELVGTLLRHHLIYRYSGEETETRYGMLESLKEYGLEQLEAVGEATTVRRRHADFYRRLATEARPRMRGADQDRDKWVALLDSEQDNMRAAVFWCIEADQIETALVLSAVQGDWFYPHAHVREAGEWIERALTREAAVTEHTRARALLVVGSSAVVRGEMVRARAHLEASAIHFRHVDDPGGAAIALTALGMGIRDVLGDLSEAEAVQTQALTLARQGDNTELLSSLSSLGWTLMDQGRYSEARTLFEECLTLSGTIGNRQSRALGLLGLGAVAGYTEDLGLARSLAEVRLKLVVEDGGVFSRAIALNNLAHVLLWQGQLREAAQLFEESLPFFREYGARRHIAGIQSYLGYIEERQGLLVEAAVRYKSSLTTWVDFKHNRPGIRWVLEAIAGLAARAGKSTLGARLLGASETLHPPDHHRHPPLLRNYRERVSALGAALGDSQFESARAAGRELSSEAAVAEAFDFLEGLIASDRPGKDAAPRTTPLSRREQEVAGLLAQGHSNREIAKRLFISERTADTHVQHILNKLGFNSRTQIAAWAVQHGLTSPASGTAT